MKKVREILVVEGKYDEIRLASVVEATVVTTDGFRVFRDKAQVTRLRAMARERGVIVLTDSDSAGLVIRNFLRTALGDIPVRHAYIPPVAGKERRKASPSKEGLLGVEGMDGDTLLHVLAAAGATFEGEESTRPSAGITKARLFEDGLSGGEQSALLRERFLRAHGLPTYLSAGKLLDFINTALTEEEYSDTLRRIREE